jgi:hypothetical protein
MSQTTKSTDQAFKQFLHFWNRRSKGLNHPRKVRPDDEVVTFDFHADAVSVVATGYHNGPTDCAGEDSHDYDHQDTLGKGVRGDVGTGTIHPQQAVQLRDNLTAWLRSRHHPKAEPSPHLVKPLKLLKSDLKKARKDLEQGYSVGEVMEQLSSLEQAIRQALTAEP